MEKSPHPVLDVKALFQLSYGLYIVGSKSHGVYNGQIANAVMQITADPLCITTCLHKENLTTAFIQESGIFSVSVLEQAVPMTFIGQFGFKCGRDIDKYCNVTHHDGPTGAPYVQDWTLAALDARVISTVEVHTHLLFVGEVVGAESFREGTPLTYADYHRLKKGKSHKNSPTSIFNNVKNI